MRDKTITCKRHLLKWYLDEVEDTHGNVLGIVHQAPQTDRNLDCDHSCQGCDNGFYPVEVYPYRVLYGTNASAGDGVAEYQVEFGLEERYDEGVDDHVPDGTLNYETMRLAGVTVTVTTTNEIVVSYDLVYDGAHYPLALTEVQRYGAGGSVSLPAMTFGYERMELAFRVQQGTGGCETEQAYENRPFLTGVANGYGGELAIGYAAWGPCEPDAGGAWFSEPFRESGWGRQTVVTYTLSGGVEGSPEVSYTYGYTNGVQAGGSFVGFEEGRTRDAAGNDSTLEHYAHGWDADHIKNGKLEEARQYQGSSTLLRETVNTWETDSLWGEEADFVWLAQQVERACQGAGSCQSKKTAYGYDAALQGGTQYGNVTSVKEYDSADANTPVRTTRRKYNTRDDSSAYIVDRLQAEAVYAQEGWTEASASWYYYDTYDSHQQVGIKGELWAVQKRLNKTEDSSFVYWDAAETRYGYDAFGNQVSATAYAGYAQMKIDKVSGAVSRNGGPTLARTTTTTYDAAYHTFPVTVTRPAVGSYVPVEAREYYGVNEQNPNTGCGVFGQVKLVRDTSNGTDTWYEYDPFGRLTYRWLPGDSVWSAASASLAYGYDDAARRLYTRQRDDPGGNPTYLEGWQFYDGLGRFVQGQSESATAGQVIVTNRAYDTQGRPEKESVPYLVQAGGGTYAAPDWNKPRTVTTYDALGRPARMTNPDGTYTEHHYDVVTEGGVTYTYDDVLDANRHRKQYRSDALGRLRQVVEMAGDCGAWGYSCGGLYTTPWSVYATTRYEYGVTDNLEEVADAAGNVTEMEYDLLGRKTAMSDPDMGDWTYGYDAVGNLASQTDAKGQTISFTYDAVDRLTLKDYPSGTDVHYYYDGETCSACSTPAGKLFGQRTAMEDGSGWTVYSYDDLRGRLTQERRSITGSGTFLTGWGYDAMDRAVGMTYPGGNGGQAGEQVTTTYNAQGLPYSVVGSSGYLLTAEYNALGQWTRRTYGNGKETRRIYRSDNFRLERIESGGAGDSSQQFLVYGYDLAGNVRRIEDWNAGTPAPQVQQFTYDHLDRLRTAVATGGSGGTYGPEDYTYDAVGNLTGKAGVGYAYSVPGANGVRPHAVRRVTGSGGSAKSVTIRAKGTASGGVWPLMSLYVNGQYRTQWMVSSSSYADYSATTTLTGNDQIEVVYSNDSGSRDLYVDYVVVDGRTVQAEGGAAVIDKGSGDAAFDGLEVIAGQQALYVNGALRFVVGTQAYAACYDANGNMTWRLLVDAAYEQLWDAENRLVQVKKGATVQATFVYDGDGARVKATVGSVTTAYVGSHFEWTGSTSTMKRYYYAGGERVAMRVGSSTVYWLLGDHLGSTAMTVASSGTWVAEVRYKAWGETRCSYGTTPTSYRFTGQRLESSLGLYLMGARWYDPGLSRWLSADTIVPNPANPQSLNRYPYVLGNPLRYRDPAGHWEEEREQQFEQQHGCPPTEQDWRDYQFSLQFAEWIAGFWEHTASLRALLWNAGVTLQRGDIGWRIAQAELVGEAVRRVQDRFGGGIRQFVGGLTVILQSVVKPWWTRITDPKALGYGGYEALGKIFLGPNMNLSAIVHEMGHYWDEKQGLSREYWNQVGGSKFIDNRFEDFAESFRHYVLDVTAWPPPGNWTCSSQGCAYPIDFNRYDFFSQY